MKKKDNLVSFEDENEKYVSTRKNLGEIQDDDPFNQEGLGSTTPLDADYMKRLQQKMMEATKNMTEEPVVEKDRQKVV